MAHSILTANELDQIFESDRASAALGLYESNVIDKSTIDAMLDDILATQEHQRLFASEEVWSSFVMIQRFFGRFVLLNKWSLEKKEHMRWRSDALLRSICEGVISKDASSDIMSSEFQALSFVIGELKSRFLQAAVHAMQSPGSRETVHAHLEGDIEDIQEQRRSLGFQLDEV